MTDEEQVRLSDRIESFVKDEGVKGALNELEKRYFTDFKNAKTDDERRSAQAKVVVLTDFAIELKSIVDRGTVIKNNNVKKDQRRL